MPGTTGGGMAMADPNGRNVISMPGSTATQDVSSNMASEWLAAPIWWRMAVLLRMRRVDLIEIMHGFDPKDANIFEQTVFQRALADAFGNEWTKLSMTADEYNQIISPYLSRVPTGPGQPPAMIAYRRFAQDMQKICEEQLSDDDLAMAMAMRGRATVTPLSQKGPKA